jgi:hypothetical protein
VESVPELFFLQDLPAVVEDDKATHWPAPLAATVSLRTFNLDSSASADGPSFSENVSVRKSVQWPSSWTDCRRFVTGTAGWLTEEEVKTAATVQALNPVVWVSASSRAVSFFLPPQLA